MRMDLGTRNTLLYDFMHCMTAVSLEMSDEPNNLLFSLVCKLIFVLPSAKVAINIGIILEQAKLYQERPKLNARSVYYIMN